MKIVIMEAATLGDDVDLSMFEKLGEVEYYAESNPLENAKRIQDADAVVVNKIRMDEALLCNAKNLKLICLTATGTNNIDFSYTNSHHITVANVKGYSTHSVVQHTFALLFYLYEKLSWYDNYVKSGEYIRSDVFSNFDMKFHELAGKTWGIIGLGAIGEAVAQIAALFGCHIIYYSTSGRNSNDQYKRVEFDELLEMSDIISIHAPLNDKTKDLIDAQALSKMKKDAVLLNLGRGPIVNQEALYEALVNDKIGGAGLDVLTVEPMSNENPLIQIQDSTKLIITPHIAWATVEARTRCAQEVYENMKAFLHGEARNVVNA